MNRLARRYPLAGVAAVLLIAVVGCDAGAAGPVAAVGREEAATTSPTNGENPEIGRRLRQAVATSLTQGDSVAGNPEIARWLAGLRQATAAFHDSATAARAGWDTRITDCMAKPDSGGMGFHYANTTLIDGLPQEFAPELLVYAPEAGHRQLVAVEYIVPFSFVPATGEAPELHGVKFHQNFDFGLWILHAWVWKHNPNGIFADWNPEVSCPM